ncbi:MAG TPA: response regulator [Candidatus Aquilonibacter sp.]|nr:response regulator [Candidatus Aquilonibacter sp.]
MTRSRTILCIDNHPNALVARKMLLENSGYNVLEATGGDEALKLFSSQPVDAVVLDYHMPGMKGDAVAARMKSMRSSVPIMLLFGRGSLPEGELSSIDSVVSKSQDPSALLDSLRHLLNSQSRPFFSRWLDHWKNRNQAVKL